ncbi:hypothetical protein ECW26_46850 [Escherichia coli W26]|nr:hypothetical protein ECW26_46850 [Escherichia coli W26]
MCFWFPSSGKGYLLADASGTASCLARQQVQDFATELAVVGFAK